MTKPYNIFTEEIRKDKRGKETRVRYDPITGDIAYISTGSKPSGINISRAQLTPSDNCVFCDKFQDPEKDSIDHAYGAVSFPNDFPTSELDFITAYPPFDKTHGILNLNTLQESFLRQMIETEYDLAKIISQQYPSMIDFTNIGPHAGANHSHPISQRKSLPAVLTGQKSSLDIVDGYVHKFWANPYEVIVREEIDAGERVIYCDDSVYIGTRFAPTYNNEIMIIPRIPFTNIVQTSEEDRKFIKPTLGIFHALYELMDCQGANICVHQAPFPEADRVTDRYRFHIHIFPRKASPPSDIGGFELGYGQQILNVLPEETAATLRKWFEK